MSRTRKLIAVLIKKERTKAGLTQQELADKLKTDRQYISKIESGKINMSLDYLDKIIIAVKCEHKKFFTGGNGNDGK